MGYCHNEQTAWFCVKEKVWNKAVTDLYRWREGQLGEGESGGTLQSERLALGRE
jgi:hypothetical protein